MAELIFRTNDLYKRFDGVQAANGVNLAVDHGEFRAIIGPNGAGKSTLFNMISGFIVPDSGHIFFEGQNITGKPPYRLFHRGISRTFQITNTLINLTVLENVQVALLSWRRRLFHVLDRAAGAYLDESQALLDLVGLNGFDNTRAGMLSHGDQKRLELAVALANKPRLLLLDEPTAGMAARERIESIRTVHRIAKRLGLTVIFTEHDMQVVFAVADRISVLHQGRLIAEGRPAEIRDSREVQDIYLGEQKTVEADQSMETEALL
jgi:branched-chain amino acid transport system ATP-binding protein